MRFKLLKQFCASVITFALSASAHALSVSATTPYITVPAAGNEFAVYYPHTTTASPFYLAPTFAGATVDLSSGSTGLNFSVTGATTSNYLWVLVTNTSGTSIAINLNSCDGGACTGAKYHGMGLGAITVRLLASSMCASGTAITGCTAGNVLDIASTPIRGVRLNFVESTAAVESGISTAEITAGTKLTVYPEIAGPDLTACPAAPGFFPGDQSLLVNVDAIQGVADSSVGSSPNFPTVWVYAKKGSLTGGSYDQATIKTAVIPGLGEQEVPGFENSTSASAIVNYGVDYGIQDSAGIILFCGDDSTTSSTPYPITNAFATDVQGFLRESNCFVATASFRNGRAPAVMLLREFRDEVLSRSEIGRGFIGWYYTNGPLAADWLIEHPVFRTFALSALLPLQAFAWVVLHPIALVIPFAALLAFLVVSFPALLGMLSLALLIGATSFPTSARAVDQPYIDSLVSELPPETYQHTEGHPDPYIQKLKQQVGSQDDANGYTEEMKKEIPPSDGSAGYAEKIQQRLPKDNGSAIEDYRRGKKLRANKGDLTTASAFGFQIAATANRTYTAGTNQDVAFDEVYGSGWMPDFKIHYEARPFSRSSFFGKFGLYGSVGASFTKANGILEYTNGNAAFTNVRSRTEFRFIMLPVNAGLIYRMNWGILFPYFGAGPSAIGFIENRNDNQPSQHGYGFGYWAMGGISLGLDWLSPRSSWEQYDSAGIKHSYLSLEYSYLTSMPGGLVEFTVDGVQVGFTFEL